MKDDKKLNLNSFHQVSHSKKVKKTVSINQQIRQLKRLIERKKSGGELQVLPELNTQLENLIVEAEKKEKVDTKNSRKEFFLVKKYAKIRETG